MRPRKWKWIIVGCVVASVAALPFIFRPPERRLLVLSTKVVSTKGWLEPNENQDFVYQWLPGNRIFAWRSLPQNKYEPMEIDAATGNEIPLRGFHKQFPQPHSWPSAWQVSPNGKWLLWRESATPMTWIATALDGSQVIRWPAHGHPGSNSYETFGIWRPDSRRWVEIFWRTHILHFYVYRLNAPAVVQYTAVQKPNSDSVWYLSDVVGIQDIIAVTVHQAASFQSDDFGFFRFPTGGSSAVATESPLHISLKAVLWPEFKFTRNGRHMVWINGDDGQSAHPNRIEQFSVRFSDWLRQLMKQPPPAPGPVQQLWVSDLDGRHKHLIGFIPPQKDGRELHSVHWMPDDKHLSFIYRDTLYTVPAD